MAFVHGHARDTVRDITWVKAHRRAPNHAEDGQLPLPGMVPAPREPLDEEQEAGPEVISAEEGA